MLLKNYDHLSDKQQEAIIAVASDLADEASANDDDYRRSAILDWVNRMDVAEQLQSISDDESYVAEVLGFNPETGERVDQD